MPWTKMNKKQLSAILKTRGGSGKAIHKKYLRAEREYQLDAVPEPVSRVTEPALKALASMIFLTGAARFKLAKL